jgi:FRG domain
LLNGDASKRAMTIKIIRVETAPAAFGTLEELALKGGDLVFRGHRDANWRLASTFARHSPVPFSVTASFELDEMISHFIVRLRSMNIDLPFKLDDRRGRLEFARHYGLPSPLIDFSRSPYVALFFAFNGVRPHDSTNSDYAAIYCLNIQELASVWARDQARNFDGSTDSKRFAEEHRNFLYENEKLTLGYEVGVLKFFSMPASWNRRMIRQLGVFLYDTIAYSQPDHFGLEQHLNQPEVPCHPPRKGVLLTKVEIPHRTGKEVFERLEIMGITATQLYDSHEGAVMDVVNAYNYGRKTGYAWDVQPPSR